MSLIYHAPEARRFAGSQLWRKKKTDLPFDFAGFIIGQPERGQLNPNQKKYLQKLEELPDDAACPSFRSAIEVWLASKYSPTHIIWGGYVCAVSRRSVRRNKINCIKYLNRAVWYAVTQQASPLILNLESFTVRVLRYIDASFANSRDLTTQLEYLIMLVDAQENRAPILLKSYKSPHISCSATPG